MPRLLAVGHVTWDLLQGRTVLGGSVTYATATARRLGWEAGALTSAGADFDPARDLPGVAAFASPSPHTTRFVNDYGPGGVRRQVLSARAGAIETGRVPAAWRAPEALLLGGVAGEIPPGAALGFGAGLVGAGAQGWLRDVDEEGVVHPTDWRDPAGDLAGVHVLFLSEHDLPDAAARARDLLRYVPIVALTRGWRGLVLHTRDAAEEIPTLPRQETDPTGAGDVFAAAFLVRYQETGDPSAAGAFAACAASCAVEGLGTSSLGDRAEVERRLALRERFVEDGEWEEA